MSRARRDLLQIYQAALDAVHGERVVATRLRELALPDSIALIAAGKAACAMARGAQLALGARLRDGFVVTKRGYGERLPWPVLEAGHPVPDAGSLAAGAALDDYIARLPADAFVLVLLSGGASALLERLPPGVDLGELQALNDWLLGSGLDIHALNAIRKRVSLLKGGRLARRLAPRHVLCLALSDVAGDDPRAIASGPLTPDDAALDGRLLPPFVQSLLTHAPAPPAPADSCFAHVRYEIVAGNEQARRAAADAAARFGYATIVHPELLEGDAATVGARLAGIVGNGARRTLHVWGGETTVRLPRAAGRGGRCQTLALAAALVLGSRSDVYLLAAGTDGADGPTEDAGALVHGETVARGVEAGRDARAALAHADAGGFLEASGDLLQTGPTGTNVMDLVLGLRD